MARTHKANKSQRSLAVEQPEIELEEEIFEEEDLRSSTGRGFDIAALVLVLIGVGISAYLTSTKIFNTSVVCVEGGGCDTVNNSKYSYILGVPVAVLGLIYYLGLLAVVGWRATLTKRQDEMALLWRGRMDLALFVMGLGGVAFTAYLKATEIFIIGAICVWCVGSAIVVSLLFILFTVRLLRS